MRTSLPLAVLASLSLVVVTLFSGNAEAQDTSPFGYAPDVRFSQSTPMAPFYRMSTAFGDAAMGTAAMIQADGNYELLTAQARILDQLEYYMAMQNKVNKTRFYIERTQLLAKYHELERLQRRVRYQEAQQQLDAQERQLAEKYRLTHFQLNPVTGTINWPALVSKPRYAAERQKIDRLLQQIVEYGYVDHQGLRTQLKEACNAFRHQLQYELANHEARDVPSVNEEYVHMDRFLKGLRYTPVLLSTPDPEVLLSMK